MRQQERERRSYRHRLRVAVLGAVLLHAVVLLVPVRLFLSPVPGDGSGADATERRGTGALQGVVLAFPRAEPAPAAASEVESTPVQSQEEVESVPEVEVVPEADPNAEEQDLENTETVQPNTVENDAGGSSLTSLADGTGTAADAGGGSSDTPGDPSGGGTVIEMALPLKETVWPETPKVVLKRKIKDYVTLKAMVGPDGRVVDVRVVRAIPNCPECSESAKRAVGGYRYDPPMLAGRAVTVWTTVTIGFGQ